jgi:L-ascorbate metabolism protein UlaG (beta-lactamase superfamily)
MHMKVHGQPRRIKSLWLILVFSVTIFLLAGAIALAHLKSVGGRVSGDRLGRITRSQHFANGKFHNLLAEHRTAPREALHQLEHGLFGAEQRVPPVPPPIVITHEFDYPALAPSALRIIWMGHASVLVEIDGYRILTDPVWSERASPVTWAGPKRFHQVPIALSALPKLDAVLISHDHYDHLDMTTTQALAARGTKFLVPLGVGAHLERWGVPPSQFTEMDWGEETHLGNLTIVAAPARHYSGRSPFRLNETLWSSWVILGPVHRVFYSGDTGYSDHFKRIGDNYGSFDVTLMKVGSSDPSWVDIHMTPEEAVQAHLDVAGRVLIPVHWGTFNLAFHSWNEPIERTVAAATRNGVQLVVPEPGQIVDLKQPPPLDYWWRSVK